MFPLEMFPNLGWKRGDIEARGADKNTIPNGGAKHRWPMHSTVWTKWVSRINSSCWAVKVQADWSAQFNR